MTIQSLEDKLYERYCKLGAYGFLFIPGSILLETRQDFKENLIPKNYRSIRYGHALVVEVIRLSYYSGLGYLIFKAIEKM